MLKARPVNPANWKFVGFTGEKAMSGVKGNLHTFEAPLREGMNLQIPGRGPRDEAGDP